MHGRGALLAVCLFLVALSHCQRQVLVTTNSFEAPLDLSGAAVQATAECGRDANGGPVETQFCTSASTCDICNAGESERSYPARVAIDGDVATAWQSPPLSQGEEFRAVNFTLDLGQVCDWRRSLCDTALFFKLSKIACIQNFDLQLSIAGVTKFKCVHGSGLLYMWFLIPFVQRFTVTSLTLRSGASPLPAVWTLHGSRDGVTFTPWRTFEAGDAPQGREVSSRNIHLNMP